MYYKGHVERMRMVMCNLGKTEVILGMLWLQTHNPEINGETREVKITRKRKKGSNPRRRKDCQMGNRQ